MPAIPLLFDQIPEHLLVPLASPLKTLYWETLVIAYRLHLSADQYAISKEALLDTVEEHLIQRKIVLEESAQDFEENSDEKEQPPSELSEQRLLAWRVLKQLQKCGWFDYEYQRGIGQVLRIPDFACKLITVLQDTAQGERPRVQGLAYNVKQILTDTDQQHADPGFVLYQAREAMAAFVRELKVLRDNMGRYVERAAEREEVRDLLALQMNDFWPKVVEPSYQHFKTSDNVLRFRMEILDRLEALENDPLFIQEAAARVESQEGIEAEAAKSRVYDWLDGMAAEIRGLDGLIEEIDARHARYVGLTLERIRHQLHKNETTESRLIDMIGTLNALPNEAEDLWDDLFETHRLQVIGEDSLYRVPNPAEPHIPEPILTETLSEQDRQSLMTQVRESLVNPVSKDRIFQEIQAALETQGPFDLADLPMTDDLEFLRLIGLHSYRNDASAPYQLNIQEDDPPVHSGAYIFRNGHLSLRFDKEE